MIHTQAQRILLYTWIILVIVKQRLVQIDRADGRVCFQVLSRGVQRCFEPCIRISGFGVSTVT